MRALTTLPDDTSGANSCNVVAGAASSRCDYVTTLGTLHFAAGEMFKTIAIPIIDDVYAEGDETFFIDLSNFIDGVPRQFLVRL